MIVQTSKSQFPGLTEQFTFFHIHLHVIKCGRLDSSIQTTYQHGRIDLHISLHAWSGRTLTGFTASGRFSISAQQIYTCILLCISYTYTYNISLTVCIFACFHLLICFSLFSDTSLFSVIIKMNNGTKSVLSLQLFLTFIFTFSESNKKEREWCDRFLILSLLSVVDVTKGGIFILLCTSLQMTSPNCFKVSD